MTVAELIDKLQKVNQDHTIRMYWPATDEFVDVVTVWEGTTFVSLEDGMDNED